VQSASSGLAPTKKRAVIACYAYRVFRDGSALVVKDRAALVARKTRAILEYLDFRPIEELAARGAIAAAAHGR
jgi:hypothetical protein